MSKSISKKILIFLFVAVASLCACVPCLAWQNAKADRVEYSADGGQTVDGTTDIESRISELVEGIEYYKNALDPEIVVVDADDAALTKLQVTIRERFAGGEYEYVSGALYGDCGLNGLLGVYEVAYEFYYNYIYVSAIEGNELTVFGAENALVPSVDMILVAKATDYIKTCTTKNPDFYTNSYKHEIVENWLNTFISDASNGLAYVLNVQAEYDALYEESLKRLDFAHDYHFSDKYGSAYVNEEVYQSSTDVSVERLDAVKLELSNIRASRIALDSAKAAIEQNVSDYEALFEGLTTALERSYNEVHAQADMNSDDARPTDELLQKSEDAFKIFESLGTLQGIILGTDSKYHEVEIDLKSGNPVGAENNSLGDLSVAAKFLAEYKALVKRAIKEAENVLEERYGVSSEGLASAYINYAKGLADCLTQFGRLAAEGEESPLSNGYKANQYSYVNPFGDTVTVVYGSDIVQALKYSPFCDGALVINDNGNQQESKKLDGFELKSTVVDTRSEDYEISLTLVDEQGEELKILNSDATLVAREGASPSVERNLYLILKGDRIEAATAGLKDETITDYLNGRVLKYFFTFEISSSTIKDGKLSVLEFDEPLTAKITIKFKNAEEFAAMKEKTCALSYCHTNIDNVYSDIEWGEEEKTMTFSITNFKNQAEIALASQEKAPFDWAKYIILGLLGLVVALFLIWIIVAIVRNWKYRIIFNANGGKYNSCIKVKLHEKFNHPAPPYRKGYKFLGWFADSKCTVRFASSELTKRRKVKVYAKWMSNEEYEKLNEQFAGAAVSTSVGTVWLDPSLHARRDANIEKIEAEKLSYEAKKAEEERKTEEVKLQAIREIDEAKKNDEARAKAEQEADEAKAKLEETLAERDELIKKERADEREKCIEEMKASSEVSDVDYEAAIAKAKEETEAKLRKEFDEESKARAEEQAKINEELLNKIKALEDANEKALAEAKAKENANVIDEQKINEAIAAGVAAKLAELAIEKVVEEKPVEEPAQEVEAKLDTTKIFDELKAEIYSYADADDLGFGLEAALPACAMKVVDDTVELEVNLELADCAKKGYKVAEGEKLPVKFVVASEDDVDEAEELIAETMLVNGLKKAQKAVVTASEEATRKEGFEYGLSKDRLADTPEEFYKLLRVHAKSFVYADDDAVEEKLLMKMFLARNKVYLYLNYGADGLKASDEEMSKLGLKTFMTVKSIDDCKEAVKLISSMMKENGLIRYPSEIKVAEDSCDKGFTYVLSK